jgi:hypothetical protein
MAHDRPRPPPPLRAARARAPVSMHRHRPDVRVYHAGKWRERFNETYPSDKRDTKKKAYLRAVLDLQEADLIELWREWVWLRDNGTRRDK